MKRLVFVITFFGAALSLSSASAGTATLTINAATATKTFIPLNAFGANLAFWTGKAGLNTVSPKLSAVGTHFFRYPGGSSSDDYHWNGVGTFDGQSHWVPDDTNYGLSWTGLEMDRGTTSSYGNPSNLTDGDGSTRWLSNADTDSPGGQWAYVDLGSAKLADHLSIDWSTPYATQFKVQYWNGAVNYPPPYGAPSDLWTDTSAGLLSGTGGTQSISFSPVSSQCYRVLCLASSTSPAQYAIAEIRVLHGASQLSVNVGTLTNNVPDQSWGTVSSTDIATAKQQVLDLDFESFMAWLKAYSPQAKPLITINFGTGTPQEAAAWVHYANVVRGYGIKDWEIGNETEGNWETGGPLNANDYGRRYIEFYQAMKAVDPSIHIYGPVAGGPYDPDNLHDGKSYIQGFIDRLAADPGGNKAGYAEGIDFHWYPMYGTGATESQSLASSSQMQTLAQSDFPSMLANHPAPNTVPVLMTEFNAGISCPLTVHLSSGLWLADSLGTLVSQFGSRANSHVWESVEGGDADTSLSGSSLGLLNGNNNAYLYQEHAQYWALQMLAQDWALPGDPNAHQLVSANSSQALLSVYADKRPDGVLSLLVVNKDPNNSYSTTLNLSGFSPNASASRWTYDASNYAWNTSSGLPYHAAPDSPPTAGTETGVSSSFSHSFGPYSITVFQFTDSTQPTNTPSLTPTPPTPTLTPTYGTHLLVDDFEDPSRTGTPPSRLNLLNGSWSTSQATGVTSTVSYTVAGANGTSAAAQWSLNVPSGGWGNLVSSIPLFNAAAAGYVGIEFWAWGDGHTYRAMIQTQSVTDFDSYGTNFTPPVGVWTLYQMPFALMARQGWGGQSPAPPAHPTATDIFGLQFAVQNSGSSMTLKLDQVGFYQSGGIATATNTRTPSATRSATPSPTPSPTATASPTITLSLTESLTETISPTFTDSATPTPSLTDSVTSTITPSFTISPTDSASATLSPTPSISPTASNSPSPSASPTVTITLSPGLSATAALDWGGPLRIIEALPQQNPIVNAPSAAIAVLLSGRAEKLRLRLYSTGFSRLCDLSLPGGGPGWCTLGIPTGSLPASNGLFYAELWAENGAESSPPRRLSLYLLR